MTHRWRVTRWPALVLRAERVIVPDVCPICLRPADTNLRYSYMHPLAALRRFVLLSPTFYIQTFSYCATCAGIVQGWLDYDSSTALAVVAWLALVGLACAAGSAAHLPDWTLPLLLAAPAAAIFAFYRWRREVKTGPPRPGGLLREPAAHYAGPTFIGRGYIYRAARPEWLLHLARMNPEIVDGESEAHLRAQLGERAVEA